MRCKNPLTVCCICGKKSRARFKGKEYCKKHYMQMYRHGHILNRTIFDKNEWIFNDGYAECVTYDKNFEPNGKVKFDIDDYAYGALTLYFDIIRLFIILLQILGNFRGNRK